MSPPLFFFFAVPAMLAAWRFFGWFAGESEAPSREDIAMFATFWTLVGVSILLVAGLSP